MKKLLLLILIPLLPSCAAFKPQEHYVILSNSILLQPLGINATVSNDFAYIGTDTYSKYLKYSNTSGGTTNKFKVSFYLDKKHNRLIYIQSKHLNSGYFTPKSHLLKNSKYEQSSFVVDNKRFFRLESDKVYLTADEHDYNLVAPHDSKGIFQARLCEDSVAFTEGTQTLMTMGVVFQCNSKANFDDLIHLKKVTL
ncbi:hypothetical protein [Vibrio sp. CK2-1]|uniref:hypothetical protein n=1 Tax=Vibrio sp. CK2-1 TaxID=2912249 RepID=UPI001F3E1CE6|nr:hypothetical protein [Vibrio sp. CK2-1]MCF7353115.1 hypothetical protein [Vibrio sp. CK2-1]